MLYPAPLQFHSVSLATAVIAGLATFGTIAVSLPASAMFLGWIAFGVGGPTIRDGAANLVSFLVGLGFGISTALVIAALTPALAALATPVAVSGVVVLVLSLRTLAPFNNPLAYFLGLTSFFYSGLMPIPSTLAILAGAGMIGAVSAAIAGLLQSAVLRTSPPVPEPCRVS